jgi:hypothetical protein
LCSFGSSTWNTSSHLTVCEHFCAKFSEISYQNRSLAQRCGLVQSIQWHYIPEIVH